MVEKNEIEVDSLVKSGKKILLDVYGEYCTPCKMLLPRLEKIEKEFEDVLFIKLDAQKNLSFVESMEIKSVPTVIFFNNGTIQSKSKGVQSESFYINCLNEML